MTKFASGISTALGAAAQWMMNQSPVAASGASSLPVETPAAYRPSLTVIDGRILVEAVFADKTPEQVATALDDAGIDWRDASGNPLFTILAITTSAGTLRTFVSGAIDPRDILKLPDVADGAFIAVNPISYRTAVGATTSQGDAAQLSDEARVQFGVDGTGIQVGVMSDSYAAEEGPDGTPTQTTVAQDIASGDLPAEGVQNLQDSTPISTDGDEGRAMLQIVHDVAPGATLSFHTARGGEGAFAAGIRALANNGADVIVDDIIYLAEPVFQDGVIAQAVDDVVASGSVYLSSAGNNGDDAFFDTYRDSGVDGTSVQALADYAAGFGITSLGNLHDWDPGAGQSNYVEMTVPNGEAFTLAFHFDEPYASAGGSGSTADYDIFITRVFNGNEFVLDDGVGFADNIDSNPVEFADVDNQSGTDFTIRIYITQFDPSDTAATNDLAGIFFGTPGGFLTEDYDPRFADGSVATQFDAPTSFGHANAAGALSVGAAAWFNTPEFGGLSEARVNGFSARSGFDIVFDEFGNRLATPIVRDGVDFVAPDGGNTTFFGSDTTADPDSFPNFFGTSASAPHAAAVVALMLQIDPTLTPEQVEQILEASADPISLDSAGRTVDTTQVGAGFLNAVAALGLVDPDPGGPVSINGTSADENFVGTDENDTIDGAGGADTITGGLGADSLFGGDGDDLIYGDNIENAEPQGVEGEVQVAGGTPNSSADEPDVVTGDQVARLTAIAPIEDVPTPTLWIDAEHMV